MAILRRFFDAPVDATKNMVLARRVVWIGQAAEATEARPAREEVSAAAAPAAARSVSGQVVASSHVVRGAMHRYRQWSADAAGRPVSKCSPGVAYPQSAPPQALSVGDMDWARFWLQKGGCASAEQLQEDGLTALHRPMLATAHWHYGHSQFMTSLW